MEKSAQKKPKPNSSLANAYLILYNLLSSLGWAYLLYLTVNTIIAWKTKSDVYEAKNLYQNTKDPLKILLATSFLEIFHAVVKIVPSNPFIIFIQVFIRFMVVWGITDGFEEASKSIGLVGMTVCWSLSETIRYLYYVFNLANNDLYILKWCRYNFFIILYPLGAFSEMVCIALAAKYIQPLNIRSKYSLTLPNIYNMSFDLYIFLWVWILIYIPGFPVMYKHMLVQRKKYLYNKQKSN